MAPVDIPASFVFSVSVKCLFVVHAVISSKSSTDFMNAPAAATLVASVTSARASIPSNFVSSSVVNAADIKSNTDKFA